MGLKAQTNHCSAKHEKLVYVSKVDSSDQGTSRWICVCFISLEAIVFENRSYMQRLNFVDADNNAYATTGK